MIPIHSLVKQEQTKHFSLNSSKWRPMGNCEVFGVYVQIFRVSETRSEHREVPSISLRGSPPYRWGPAIQKLIQFSPARGVVRVA